MMEKIRGLDYHVSISLKDIFHNKRCFSFGKSTDDNGFYLNEGLNRKKEGFDSRNISHGFCRLNIE